MRLVTLFGATRLLASDNTEQSGSYMNSLWKTAFRALPKGFYPKSILFLGVGTGGALHLAQKRFRNAHITGIEWDATLITLAKNNLLQHPNITLIEADAETWIHTMPTYDLVCIDLFTGADVAPCVRDIAWMQKLMRCARMTIINVYQHTDILNTLETTINLEHKKQITYYASTLGIYG